ncbi:formate dehydrogenase family accessory protein FdhD [Gammaproteobacteria bacterium 53_120_T64]|nr:formate dehydrogenase family accessory protein FdhD [Gammaproteobacteria bacterium 53_120_T64]
MKAVAPPVSDEVLAPAVSASVTANDWRQGVSLSVDDQLIEEVAVALVYNGISHVVMMTTPDHLEDFALGFSLTEGIIENPKQLYELDTRVLDDGIEIAMTISNERFALLKAARRNMTGRTGCGLCGAESLEQAIRQPAPVIAQQAYSHSAIETAVAQLESRQPLQAITGAVHGAALCHINGNIELLREDVGRHNALDKLYGAVCKQSGSVISERFVLISSRASYELVLKAAVMGVGMLVAVSAPTSLAVRLAEQVNITLVGFARSGRHMVYTHPERIVA